MIDLAALAKRAGGSFDGKNARIPGPGHSQRDRSLSLSIGRNGRLIAHSFAGDDDAVIGAYLRALGVDASSAHVSSEALRACERAGQRQANAIARMATDLWRAGAPLAGSLGARYFESRGIGAPWPAALRFHPACPDGPFKRPALIAARTRLDASQQVGSIQRTFFDGEAHKIARKSLGACKGGGVLLGEIGEEALVAEGIETALSAAAMFKLPAIATLGTAFTAGLSIPERVRRVLIAADNDEPGLRAAHKLAARLRKEGRKVRIETPPVAYKDFNDVATGKERGADTPRSFRGGGPPHGV
jgi:putative DNA primase/helicase